KNNVYVCDIAPKTNFIPVHPDAMLMKREYSWKRSAMILAGITFFAIAVNLLGTGILLASCAGLMGGVVGNHVAQIYDIGYQVDPNQNANAAYRFEAL
ncbi:MAG TPA: hypothetical protein PLD88_11340, partial [Candidatus Berkiella sp.]|nr:hypothetical protein [Candidatus Berkiella sp.]